MPSWLGLCAGPRAGVRGCEGDSAVALLIAGLISLDERQEREANATRQTFALPKARI